MIQAIVFLPLLGFILAAAISLVGARARFPGAEPSDDDHHHAPAHAAHDTHAHAADAHHDDHSAPAEPAAAGSRAAEIITTSLLMISAVLSWIVLWKVGFGHTDERIQPDRRPGISSRRVHHQRRSFLRLRLLERPPNRASFPRQSAP